ncbi:MAG TPA: Spy/CpxP family protein refolding chaperone, partial [Steroidobacteraceae bacterium]|nr:Spy/CpxP family protein refolding chaperone [Steroidobacteraceae bacterium]
MMMGPGMMGWRSMGRDICDPRTAGLAEWRINRLERAVRPTEAQRPALDQLKVASKKAAEIISAACPRELSQSPVTRLEAMEKR